MDWFLAIVALCLVIIIHEFGHYTAAVATGMRVDRFSIFGIGPVVARLGTWRGTEFVISAIPFGAYVMIAGMEPEDENEDKNAPRPEADRDPSAYRNKPLWARFLVLFGGPASNYIAATVILFGVYSTAGAETIEIGEFTQDSAAQAAGLETGDQLIQIGNAPIDASLGAPSVLAASQPHMGQTVEITVRRGDETLTRPVALPAEPPALGVILAVRASGRPVSLGEATTLSVAKPWIITSAQLGGLYKLVTGQLDTKSMSGPVGIVKHIKRSAEAGLIPFMIATGLISTLLGLFNLLPLPALDGGRIAFLGYEMVARKPANGRFEGMVHGYGMLALLLLIALITVGDIRNL